MEILGALKYLFIFVVGLISLYLTARVISSGIFRSWFEIKHTFKGGQNGEEINERTNERKTNGKGEGAGH